MYITATRPNIMFVVSLIRRFMARSTELHLQVAKRALQYLKGTVDYEIFYKKCGNKELVAFTDSDYAWDLEDKRSISGYVFMLSGEMLSGEAVCWSLKKQPTVTLSITKAEFVEAATYVY